MDEYALPEGQVDNLFGVEKSNKATEYDLGIGGMGDLVEFDGTIQYDDFRQQYRTSYSHKEWVKGIKIERKLVDDDLYNVINKRPAQLAVVAKRTREKHGASIFNNALTYTLQVGIHAAGGSFYFNNIHSCQFPDTHDKASFCDTS